MEKLSDKIKESQEEASVKRVRKELAGLKEENLKKKEKGEGYNINYTGLDLNYIGPDEARLWEKMKAVKTNEDWEAVNRDFYFYKEKIRAEVQAEREKGFKGAVHPKDEFSGLFGNEMYHFDKSIKGF